MQSQGLTNSTHRPVVLFSLIILVVVLLTLMADYAASRWQREEQKITVNQQLSVLRAALEFELYTNIELIRGAAAYVSLNPDLNQQGFSEYMGHLHAHRNNIVNIAGARDLIVNLIYPVTGNEKVLGLNYRLNEAQRDSVLKALHVGTTVLSGPVELVQGGVGFIARLPVINENGTWGILSVVLDYHGVLKDAGFIDEQTLNLRITERNAHGQMVDVFRNAQNPMQEPVRLSIDLPYGQWQLTAQPREGWKNFTLHPVSWALATIIGLIACYIAQLRLNNRLLQQDTLSALKLSERKFRQFFSAHAVIMLIIDDQGEIVDANRAAVNYYGYSAEQMAGMSVVDIQTMDRDTVLRHIKTSMTQKSSKYAVQHRLASGEIRDVEVLNSAIESAGRQLIYTIVIDITERLEYQKRWELSQQVFNHSLEGIIVTDAHLRIVSVNPAFTHITGYCEDEVTGLKPDFLGTDLLEDSAREQMKSAIELDGFWRGEVWNRRKNGSVFPELLSISVVKDDAGKVVNYLAVFSDITSLKRSEEKLERLAHFDALTGLPNRVQFQLHLQDTVSRCQQNTTRCALLYLDLDRFKVVNDSLGHIAGDELLRMVTERLSKRLGTSGLLARMGGDEFVLLVEHFRDDTELEKLASTLIEQMNQPFYLAGEHEVNVGGSVGIARYPTDASSSEDLLVRADAAMYKAKQAGGARLAFFTGDILVEASSRLTIASELKRAVAENELELYLQPQIDAATGDLAGAEALLRWNHPTKGFLTPYSFIDVAEQTRAIRLVTGWLVTEVFGIIERWQARYPRLFISFNVSALDLADNELLRRMGEALEAHPVDASRIELEIVESAIIENFESASSILAKLRKLGFCVAIDDFGTGYSSLAYLDKLPVDKLKIDREFISKLGAGEQSGVVKSIIDLAGNFNLRVVAEGVETSEQEQLLKAMGCNRVQGYYYSIPLPLPEFEAKYLTL